MSAWFRRLPCFVLFALLVAGCRAQAQPAPAQAAPAVPVQAPAVTGAPAAPGPGDFSVGTNLSGIRDWSTEIPWKDVFKIARVWISQRQGAGWGQGPALQLDEHGWPARLAPGCFAETLLLTGNHDPGGEFVCLYDGRGEITFNNVAGFEPAGPGRIVVQGRPNQTMFLRITATDPADPVRNIRVVRAADEATYGAQPWRDDFLQRWDGFSVIRFMDWMDTNGSKIVEWDDRPKVDDFSQATHGVALEWMLDYINRTGADPWFCMPHLASDDYVRRFAEAVRDGLDPGKRVYVEYSNEIWNGQFAQTRYCGERGQALGLSDNPYQATLRYASQRSQEIFDIWTEAFGGTDRLVRVMAGQAANPWVAEQKLAWKDGAQKTDAVAIAPYFGGGFGSPRTQGEVQAMSVDQLLAACRAEIEDRTRKMIADHLALAANPQIVGQRPLPVIAYEAGQHLVGHGGAENNEPLMNLFLAANRDPRMADLYRLYIDQWRDLGGGLLVNFSSVARPSKWGSWGLLEAETQDPATAPKWLAVQEYVGAGG